MGLRRTAALCAALWLTLLLAHPATATAFEEEPDRLATIRSDLATTGVYLEPGPAMGDVEFWRKRLVSALAEAELGTPLAVALWARVPGTAPDDSEGASGRELLDVLGRDTGVAVIADRGYPRLVLDVAPKKAAKVQAVWTRSQAVVDGVEAASPEPNRYQEMTPVAQVWVFLRVAAADGPARELIAELSGDVSLLSDHATVADKGRARGESVSPTTLTVAGLVVAATIGLFAALTLLRRSRRSSPDGQPDRPRASDPLLEELTPLALEEELADLAESIAASEVMPGETGYDRAQGCADAAARYVDSPLERDRVGVHLLIEEARAALAGDTPRRRCFFHPLHHATTSVSRRKVALPCCRSCARWVTAGSAPRSLLVADEDGDVRAYYETDDVWSATGYGAIDERWARRVLLAALELR